MSFEFIEFLREFPNEPRFVIWRDQLVNGFRIGIDQLPVG